MLRHSTRFLASTYTADVTIIGGGVIGCATALHLARDGVKVRVIETNRGPGEGTTSYSSGVIRTFYSLPECTKMAWDAYHTWQNWKDYIQISLPEDNYPAFRERGSVLLRSKHSKKFLDQVVATAKSVGIEVHELDLQQTDERVGKKLGWTMKSFDPMPIDDPRFGEDNGSLIEGSVYVPQTAYIADPRLATENMYRAAKAAGAEFSFKSRVTAINQRDGAVTGVTLADGSTVDCPAVLNAAGAHSALVTKLAFPEGVSGAVKNDMNITARALRAEVAIVDSPPEYNWDENGVFTADMDLGIYLRPEPGNRILLGGIEPACDTLHYFDTDPDEMEKNITDDWTAHVYRSALRIPSLEIPTGPKVRGIVSCYDVTPDWSAILDKSALKGYYMAIGTSGNAFKNSPVIGNLMSDLIQGVQGESEDYKHLDEFLTRPTHFKLKNIKDTISIGKFSRLRKAHDTTATVLG